MKKYILSIFLITILYSESITIYSTESARYISNSGNSCCTPYILTGYNQSSMYLSTCGTNNYGQCWGTIAAAIWKFDLSTLPNNIEIVTANFEYEYDQSLCTGGIINTSNYNGNIVDGMAYDLWHTPDWEDNIWSSVECNPNDGIHIANIDLSQIINGFQTGQINILRAWGDDASINNSGINAPRLVIEYEIEMSECPEMNEPQCSNDDECDWIEDIETGSCSTLSLSVCDLPEYGPCYSYCTNWGYYYNCTGETICTGGLYEIDNSYCQDIPYQLGDVNQDSIINIQDIIIIINLILNAEFALVADINLDSTINVLDVIQLVNIILN